MINYADITFYKQIYLCGKKAVIDNTSFEYYARNATQKIKQFTFDNVDEDNIPECVKMCCCEVAELMYINSANKQQNISSETVGDQSVSYVSNDVLLKTLQNNIRSAIYMWLADTGLLYRGVR